MRQPRSAQPDVLCCSVGWAQLIGVRGVLHVARSAAEEG
jgi:hypothetical protein